MKKALLSFCLALGTLFWGAQAEAQFNKGGFTGPKDGTDVSVSVADAKNMKDEAYVTLKGKIVKKIGSEKYLFEDQSGSIDIEIDDKDWRGLVVGPGDVVIIEGEVDKGWTKLEIEVDNIRKAN